MSQPPAALTLARFLPYRFSVVAEMLSRYLAQTYEARFGLTIPEWRVMAVLGEEAPIATQDVIERTQMDRVRVSRAVIRLADKALILRHPHPRDQRAQLLQLSEAGLAIYRQVVPTALAIEADLLAALDDDERRALDAILDKLKARAGAFGGDGR